MKRRTTPTLIISIPKIEIDDVKSIEFLFKNTHSEKAKPIIKKSYPDEVSFDADTKCFMLSFTEEETLLFTSDKAFMDTRICLQNGNIPPTNIVTINVDSTLFGDADI